MQEIEIRHIDRSYESFRIIDKSAENRLLASIIQKGIIQPLCGILKNPDNFILLDGFKRLRCAQKINIQIVKIEHLGMDENEAILKLIRISTARHLSTLEQAILLNQVYKTSGLSVRQIADELSCSSAWVSVRLGIIENMSEKIKRAIFSGRFPLRNYMYTIRSFTRVKGESAKKADKFVELAGGKNLSTRDIDKLAYAYFNGGEQMQKQIENGNFLWTLDQMRNIQTSETHEDFDNDLERKVIHYLELVQKYMNLICKDIGNTDLKSNNFIQNADLLIEGILKRQNEFTDKIKRFLCTNKT